MKRTNANGGDRTESTFNVKKEGNPDAERWKPRSDDVGTNPLPGPFPENRAADSKIDVGPDPETWLEALRNAGVKSNQPSNPKKPGKTAPMRTVKRGGRRG